MPGYDDCTRQLQSALDPKGHSRDFHVFHPLSRKVEAWNNLSDYVVRRSTPPSEKIRDSSSNRNAEARANEGNEGLKERLCIEGTFPWPNRWLAKSDRHDEDRSDGCKVESDESVSVII